MSSFTGTLAPDAIYYSPSGFNPAAVDSREAIPSPPYPSQDSGVESAYGAATAALPLATHGSTLTGTLAPSFGATDWYNRVHVIPATLTLGNVVSDEIFIVAVWNGWLTSSRTLESIGVTGGEGISLSGQADPPLVFAINQQLNYTLTVLTIGPPSIAATYTFTFDDSEVDSLSLTGSRITAWALTPDYSQSVKEKLAWLTDRKVAWDGTEQRRALRLAPRRTVSFSTPVSRLDKQYVENQLFAWGALIWALPIWWDSQLLATGLNPGDVTVLCDTVDRDFVAGGLAILIASASQYEVIQITDFTTTQLNLTRVIVGSWPANSKLYPVRSARLLTTTRISRINGAWADLEPSFQIVEPCDWPPATGLPTYRSNPVLEDSPDTDNTADGSYERETFTIDTSTGDLTVYDSALVGFPTNSHNWFLNGKTARANFRALLYALKGQVGEIWVPTYEEDLEPVAQINAGDVNIECASSGFGVFSGTLNRQDIRIELYSGTVYYRRITGSVQDSETTELITINAALGVNVPVSSIRRISFMALSILSADEITIEHLTAVGGVAIATTPFRATNHDV